MWCYPLLKDVFGRIPLDIAYQECHYDIVSLLQDTIASFHDDDQESLAGSIESGYTTGRLSTDHSSVADSDIAQFSDLEEDIMEITSFAIAHRNYRSVT